MLDVPIDEEGELVFEEVTVRCPTPGCYNFDVPIVIYAPVGGAIVCGPCGTALTPERPGS